jgi:hypothetical protein
MMFFHSNRIGKDKYLLLRHGWMIEIALRRADAVRKGLRSELFPRRTRERAEKFKNSLRALFAVIH